MVPAPQMASRALWWQRRNPVPNGQALQQPKAVDRNLSHRGPCGGKPQTPRAGRWREGGLAVLPYRTAVSAEIAVLLRLRERPGPVGPLDPRRPAPPRIFPGAHRPKSLGRKIAPRDRGRISKSEGRAMNEILITTS